MTKILYSSEDGDLRKKSSEKKEAQVDLTSVVLHLRRLTSGKGRAVIEISNLPANSSWCKEFAKEIKKKLGVGGTYINGIIEIHGEKFDELKSVLDSKKISFKKTGG
jgi:translation initiation factor 1